MRTDAPGAAFRRGWIVGGLAYAAGIYWVALPLHDYGGLPWYLAVPCPVLLGLYMGLYTGVFALGVRSVRGKLHWTLAALWAGGLWAALEAVRGVMLTGFPWLVLSSAFSPWPFAVQGVSVLGAAGFSGLLAGAASLLVIGRGATPRVAAVAALVLPALWGAWLVGVPVPQAGQASVVIAQGNIDQTSKWDEAYRLNTIKRYKTLTLGGVRQAPADLAVWPETALPFYLQEPNTFSVAVRKAVREAGVPVLTGTPAYTYDANDKVFLMHNRAVLLDADAAGKGFYDKEHLVPFGEYVPMGELLPFIKKLAEGAGDFVPGRSTEPLRLGPLRLGVLICYETIFPELAQARVTHGANLLVNISNDAWFGRSSAPLQHLHLSVLRAVEQRRSIVRATNTGISAFIDPRGRITGSSGIFEADTLRSDDVRLVTATTFFHRHRLSLGAGLAVMLGLCASLALLDKKRNAKRLANGLGSR